MTVSISTGWRRQRGALQDLVHTFKEGNGKLQGSLGVLTALGFGEISASLRVFLRESPWDEALEDEEPGRAG